MPETTYAGIDYGLGKTNIDKEAGIRYGVIPIHDVLQAWADSSEAEYPVVEVDCPECGWNNVDSDDRECTNCQCDLTDLFEEANEMNEPASYYYNEKGYKLYQDADDADIFVEKSPYYTYAQFCSPCAPGACHLGNWLAEPVEGNKCYCLGSYWFDDEKAPYPVYSVETGELVAPEAK